jgi:hypothetical protein
MSVTYGNFDLRLTADNRLEATSQEGEAGPAPFELDRNAIELAQQDLVAEQADPELVRQVGQQLYRALFPVPILALFERSRATAPDRHLRLRLCIEAEAWVSLPWELLHDGEAYLSLREELSVVRYTKVPQPPEPLPVRGPLRILVVIASPDNLPSLHRDIQADELKVTLSGLQTQGRLEVEFLPHGTYAGLMRRLRTGGFHVLHYLGYTALDTETRQPVLLFEEENGLARKVSGDDLRELLLKNHAEEALRLIVINDCEQAAGPGPSYGLGVALRLVQLGLPAVLTLQYSLPDTVVRRFAAAIYGAIAEGQPLDVAVFRGRDRIKDEIEAADGRPAADQAVPGEWASPVLFMQSTDGQIFQPQQVPQSAPARSSERIYDELDAFKVESHDRPTRFFLDKLPYFTLVGALATLIYGFVSPTLDLLFFSGVAVVYGCLWLLRSLFREKVPATFDTLWRRGLIVARDNKNLPEEYLKFLQDYNALLNHPWYAWIPRALGLAIALLSVFRFNYGQIPQPWRLPLQLLVFALVPLGGYILGTLLWKMVATVIATRQLSERFDLDIHPSRPDGCGGLKPLGDLYFAHAQVLLLAGLFVALWLLIFTLSLPLVENYLVDAYPDQAALLDDYPSLCAQGGLGSDGARPAAFSPAICTVLARAMDPEPVAQAPRHLVVLVVAVLGDRQPPPLVSLAMRALTYYDWLGLYQVLLVIITLIAVLTFAYPMFRAQRIMHRKAKNFRHRADSIAGEISELEKYLEQYGPRDRSESAEISHRLKWLQEHYQYYNNPPLWPFDTRVRFRMLGSLAGMASSWAVSEIVPRIARFLRPLVDI